MIEEEADMLDRDDRDENEAVTGSHPEPFPTTEEAIESCWGDNGVNTRPS